MTWICAKCKLPFPTYQGVILHVQEHGKPWPAVFVPKG